MRRFIDIVEEYDDDEDVLVPEPRPYILRAGTTVFHGTNQKFQERHGLDGPIWVTDSVETAEYFARWKDGEGKARVTTWEVRSDYRLAMIDSGFLEALEDVAGITLQDGPEDILNYLRFRGFEGWIIPDNYGTAQADICLNDPSGLSYVRTKRL